MTDAPFQLGDRVVDTEARTDDHEEAVVVELPDRTAAECYIGALDATVADVNPDYPSSDPVVTVAFVADLDTWASGWAMAPADVLADELALIDEILLYTYPASRLASAGEDGDGREE